MQFASALSREVQTEAAVSAVLDQVAPQLPEQHAHLSFVFASPHHLKAFPRLLHVMQERFATHTLIGCTGRRCDWRPPGSRKSTSPGPHGGASAWGRHHVFSH